MGSPPELRSLRAGWQRHRAQGARGHQEFPQGCWQSRRSISGSQIWVLPAASPGFLGTPVGSGRAVGGR